MLIFQNVLKIIVIAWDEQEVEEGAVEIEKIDEHFHSFED